MKKVLVTAGLSNLGRAIRKEFEDNGYDVYYTVSSEEKKDGEKAIVLDLRKEESVEALPFFFSTLDALINNAGIFTEGKQESLPSSLFDEVFAVNMKGLFLVTKALLPLLQASDGAIVNISSMNAIHPGFGTTAHYNAVQNRAEGAVYVGFKALLAVHCTCRNTDFFVNLEIAA